MTCITTETTRLSTGSGRIAGMRELAHMCERALCHAAHMCSHDGCLRLFEGQRDEQLRTAAPFLALVPCSVPKVMHRWKVHQAAPTTGSCSKQESALKPWQNGHRLALCSSLVCHALARLFSRCSSRSTRASSSHWRPPRATRKSTGRPEVLTTAARHTA